MGAENNRTKVNPHFRLPAPGSEKKILITGLPVYSEGENSKFF